MHRVVVNPGSAADLLQLLAFRQMKAPFGKLSSASIILFVFNRETTLTMGDITLPVKAGPVIQQVLFSVLEDLGP